MRNFSFGFFFLFLYTCTSCISEHDIKVEDIKSFRIKEFTGKGIQCSADVVVQNNYFLPVTVEGGNIYAYSGKDKIGSVKILKPVKLKSKTRQQYTLDFEIELSQPLTGLKSIFGSLTGIKQSYELKGTLVAKQFFFKYEMEIDKRLTNN